LAQINPDGVPHAEMEEWTRDAWQIFANEFEYTGEPPVGGVQYIRANIGCPYDCTEGDGYALIAAAFMADKTTFDGIWMRFHDRRLRKRPRYRDGVIAQPGYLYGNTPMDNADSAADGDFDAALGILMAWYQWGDDSGVPIFGGGTMSYRDEAEYALRAIVEKSRHFPPADCRVTTGHIGFDGYVKAGNTWNERTNWAGTACPNTQFNGPDGPEYRGPSNAHIDYIAPSYFRAFGDFLQNRVGLPAAGWEVTQYRRAEASSDWLMGQLIAQGANTIPVAGMLTTLTNTNATFGNENAAEDARMPWRTILNYVWNGHPTTSWNPATKQVVAGVNTYEYQAAVRHSQFLSNPQGAPWNNACVNYGGAPGLTFRGPVTVNWTAAVDGSGGTGTFNLNWLMGSGSPAAVAAQNYDLMAELFRQNTIEWDVTTEGDGYLTSKPFYFHGFFRWLGMHVLSGNHLNPAGLVMPGASPPSNMKIYKSVDRTYAFPGDTLTYWINYRNYASVAANNVVIMDTLPVELGFVSASPAPASAPAAGSNGVVRWNLAAPVPGLQNQNYNATQGGITLVARVLASTGRFCNTATVSTSNGTGWTSNQYPNEVSMVMKRNCVDIVPEVMSLTKTAAPAVACSGDRVTFSLNYRNNPGQWINGGRPDVVVSFGHDGLGAADNQLSLRFRLMHAADEPYIDYGNYRISYFVNDTVNLPGTWNAMATICEGCGTGAIFSSEALPPGPTWNQRWIIKFGNQMAAPATHLYNYTGLYPRRIHRGGVGGQYVMRGTWMMNATSPVFYGNYNQLDDWSADTAAQTANDGAWGFPIGADWTAGDGTSQPVTRIHPDACQTAAHTVTNILVEEWDGYTWRRAFGNGPVAGRQLANMVISDALPPCMTFGGFIGVPAGVTATVSGQTVSFAKAQVNINESGTFQFWATAGSCAGPVDNTATMSAAGERPVQSTVTINPGAACGGTPTRTPTRTPSVTSSRTASPSATPSASPTRTATSSPSRSASPSASPSPTVSPSSTATRSATPSATPPAETPTSTLSASPTLSRTPTPTATASPSQTPSRTASALSTATPSDTPTRSATPTATVSPSVTVTFLDTFTVSPTVTPTGTPSASPTATATASPTRTDSPTAGPSATGTLIASATSTPSVTATATLSATRTHSPTATLTATLSPAYTPTFTPTGTPSPSVTATRTESATGTPTSTVTGTRTATPTPSATPTATTTRTATLTATGTPTTPPSPLGTPSVTVTLTPTPYLSPTITPTFSASPTFSVKFYQQPDLVEERGVYPNPFSDKVRLYFSLRVSALVRFTVYNVAGEPLFRLEVPGQPQKNEVVWDGVNDAGARCASGVYILRVQAEGIDGSNGGYWTTVVIQR
jgi:uncharacterized repeat protein (TIGR01451 family)